MITAMVKQISIFACGIIMLSCSHVSERALVLSDGWTLISPDGTQYPAGVPSTVMGTLVDCGVYSRDILESDNYASLDASVFDKPWTYKKNFSLSANRLSENILLEFDGLNYSADIILNGYQIASADTLYGPYRRYSFDISAIAAEDNTLEVILHRAGPGDLNIGFVDWNPRPLDQSLGIFREVRLDFCDKLQLRNTAVRSTLNSDYSIAELTLVTELRNLSDAELSGVLRGSVDGRKFRYEITVPAGQTLPLALTSAQIPELRIDAPRLWWSRDMGSPEMYDLSLSFHHSGKQTDTEYVSFGIRELESGITAEGTRQLYLNGRRVLLRGAGWTDDIFLRNPEMRNQIEIAYVTDMNLNTLRFENIWGISQNVYDLCDMNGLLVMLGWSCFWEWETYTGSPDGEYGCIVEPEQFKLMGKSLEDQILWLRNHPSIVMFLGGSDKIPHPELEQIYVDVLDKLAPDLMYVTSAKGLESSVAGYSGMRMVGPYDYVGPSYWFEKDAPGCGVYGFNTETGVGAQIPQKESVMRMIPQDGLWPVGDLWDYHCTTAGEAMHSLDVLKDVMDMTYGPATSLDDFLKKADLLSFDSTRSMFEAFRANISSTGGIIQWMLNSAWPSMYWQLYDWYLVPTAAYYAVRQANEPVQMLFDYKDGSLVAVNETAAKAEISRDVALIAADGQVLFQQTVSAAVEPAQALKVADLPEHGGGLLFVGDNTYALPSANEQYDWVAGNWIRTPLAEGADFAWMDTLAEAELSLSVLKKAGSIELTLTNNADVPAFFIRAAVLDGDGRLITPAHWSDNYISLRPHQSRVLSCETVNLREASSLVVEGWNIPANSTAL